VINLYSDNVAPVAPEVMAALERANARITMSYGNDEFTREAKAALEAVFEHRLALVPVPTGTAANALSMSLLCRPYGAVFASECAHLHTAEAGATEFFTGGAKIIALPAPDGRLDPAALEQAISRIDKGDRHRSQPDVISLTNGTELGTVYSPAEVRALADVARRHGLAVHMDGARLGNALASLACGAAELSWKAGVDVLSLGMTKNCAMGADYVIAFDEARADEAAHRAQRYGYTFSKMRYATAQLTASLRDGQWLRHARAANAAAAALATALRELPEVTIAHPVQINQIFLRTRVEVAESLEQHGLVVAHWGDGLVRIVTSWATDEQMVAGAVRSFKNAIRSAR
jgi:threonine aldolase